MMDYKKLKLQKVIKINDIFSLRRKVLSRTKMKTKSKVAVRVAQWLATCARKPKVPGSSPAASYVQRSAVCSNCPANF